MNTQIQPRVPRWTLGDRLRKARRDAGYTARDFAQALGVTNSALSQYETDRARPRDLVDLAQRVEAVTGVPATWLLGLDESPGPADLDPEPGPAPPILFSDVPLFDAFS